MANSTLKARLGPVETLVMSDLSKVLGDLYGSTDPDAAPVSQEPAADERRAPVVPIEAQSQQEQFTAPGEDLQSVLDDALAKLPGQEMTAVETADDWAEHLDEDDHHLHTKGALRAWVRTDDDYLPTQGKKFKKRK